LYKIAVLGERASVMGFSALGLDVFAAENEAEARNLFRSITEDAGKYAIIYVTETYFLSLKAQIDKFRDQPVPAVILIPGAAGDTGLGRTALNEAVEKAVGANIL